LSFSSLGHLLITQEGKLVITCEVVYKKEMFIWAPVLEVSVHGQLVPLLWGLWQGRTSWWGICGGGGVFYLMMARKQRERKNHWSQYSFQGHAPIT
jgi:hypothetical protein